jgi:hypothetical protein
MSRNRTLLAGNRAQAVAFQKETVNPKGREENSLDADQAG